MPLASIIQELKKKKGRNFEENGMTLELNSGIERKIGYWVGLVKESTEIGITLHRKRCCLLVLVLVLRGRH